MGAVRPAGSGTFPVVRTVTRLFVGDFRKEARACAAAVIGPTGRWGRPDGVQMPSAERIPDSLSSPPMFSMALTKSSSISVSLLATSL